ncbi:MAG: DegV family protein [Clostridia bacterium]|nr:DegV family protein [Clostridia bacterium]
MNEYVIVTDSSADLELDTAKENGIEILDLMVVVEGEAPKRNREVDVKEFYKLLREKKGATTAALNIDDFANVLEPIAASGKDILYLGFSSGLSGTYAAGKLAAEELSEKYPERKIYTCDTLCASLGEGLLVYLAAMKKKAGATIEEVRDFVENSKLNLCHWFTVDDLFFLKRGGRVSAATAVLGTMLSIKPVMHVDNAGKLINVEKARGRRDSVNRLFEKCKTTAIDISEQTVFICHGDCIEDAEYLADRIKNELGVKEVFIGYTGPVIGAHSGPGTLAIFYIGTER